MSDGAIDDALYPSRTAEDWVTYADHVLVATVSAERGLTVQPEKGGAARQDREVSLQVDRTLWSTAHPARPAPESLTWPVWGWRFEGADRDHPIRIAVQHRSRLEIGHTYVIPVRYEPARFSEDGGSRVPGRWVPLAGDSIYPDDTDTIGTGEVAGRSVRAETNDSLKPVGDPNRGLREEVNGWTPGELAGLLRTTAPGGPPASARP